MKKLLTLLVLMPFTTSAYAEGSLLDKTSIGVGLGIPYGILGVNISHKLSNKFDLTVGAGVGFGAGVRYRPLENYNNYRLTAFYGTNSVITNNVTNEDEYFSGLNIGIGHGNVLEGFDFDILYAFAPSSYKDRVAEIEAAGFTYNGDKGDVVTVSFGYHW